MRFAGEYGLSYAADPAKATAVRQVGLRGVDGGLHNLQMFRDPFRIVPVGADDDDTELIPVVQQEQLRGPLLRRIGART